MRIIYLLILLVGFHCTTLLSQNYQISMDTASVVFIKKPFISKSGKVTNRYEWYARLSVQDYFIKFCESSIKKEALEERFDPMKNEMIKSGTIRYQIDEGNWDECEDLNVQSRTGPYIIIHEFLK